MNYRKKPLEEIPEENTAIWSCTKEGCKGWMRDNFAFENEPTCRLCNSPMVRDMKMLPLLVNPNGDLKSIKKGVQID
ncbi:cold-shock protein [Paenibacillus apiarius]|uniref:Cold-shock protein n=1 Tax=Paenibacillus apiarius TaxID=46240 RepID=A0ABT4DRX2_9BACL|nr:cold-shock protein [Paenibacillus apiarius]MBN3524582.1 cold-shock protein [Paenibacillus apiarius]MCY9514318.1 cold-shock protein [Paenibacillus apiarius]MCY9520099.1 cold-shock protein [Paenibacillus apiarius]MCY9550106.1 cold-shock protein [Paenibacillus apiarius]MCY9560283.1 cold-shock protein [Paenibacillus apiarius]